MITIKKTSANDIELLMQIRLEMLRIVNGFDSNEAQRLRQFLKVK